MRARVRNQLRRALALVAIFVLMTAQALAEPASSSEDDLRLLEIRLEPYLLSDAMPSFAKQDDVLLPLGELAQLLTIAVTTDPEQGTAAGYVLDDSKAFDLDVANESVTLGGRTIRFDTTQVEIHPDDIYVASGLISEWFPVDFDVDLPRSRLRVRATQPLPLQQRLERERRNARLGSNAQGTGPDYPRQAVPYKALTTPSIDQTIGIEARRGPVVSTSEAFFSTLMTGDLFGMQSRAYVSGREHGDIRKRITLGRDDPDAELLGPLHASSFAVGSVPTPSVRNIVRAATIGNGFMLSNYPLTRPQQFDRQTFQGDLLPGWDVELYQNGALMGYRQAEADGRYSFEDVPLGAGANDFRLVFRGPQGQVREEQQTFLVEDSLVPVGDVHYRFAGIESEHGRESAVAQFDWGLSRHVSASTGMHMIPVGDTTQRYLELGLNANWAAMTMMAEYLHSDTGGNLAELALKTRLGRTTVSLSHALMRDFSSEVFYPTNDPVSSSSELRVDGTFSSFGTRRMPFSLELTRRGTESGREDLELSGRVSALIERAWVTNQLRAISIGGVEAFDGVLQLSRGFRTFGLRGLVNYAIAPTSEITAFALTAERRLGFGYVVNSGITRTLVTPDIRYHLGLSKQLGRYGLGINTSYTRSGELSLSAQFFASLGRDPRTDDWVSESLPMADSGFASVRVFLDENLNGVMDTGEQALPGVGFTVNGAQRELRTNNDGVAYLRRLPTRQGVNLAVDPTTLEDPQWALALEGIQVVPRAGTAAELDFPVIMTGEVDGVVYVVKGERRRPAAGVTLELLAMGAESKVIRQVKTASDGFFLVESVPPGEYLLRVAEEDMKRSKLTDTGTRVVTVTPKGDVISGVDLYLTSR